MSVKRDIQSNQETKSEVMNIFLPENVKTCTYGRNLLMLLLKPEKMLWRLHQKELKKQRSNRLIDWR